MMRPPIPLLRYSVNGTWHTRMETYWLPATRSLAYGKVAGARSITGPARRRYVLQSPLSLRLLRPLGDPE